MKLDFYLFKSLQATRAALDEGDTLDRACARGGLTPHLWKKHAASAGFDAVTGRELKAESFWLAMQLVAAGEPVVTACREAGISPRTYYRQSAKPSAYTEHEIKAAIAVVFEHATKTKSEIDMFARKLLSVLQLNKTGRKHERQGLLDH